MGHRPHQTTYHAYLEKFLLGRNFCLYLWVKGPWSVLGPSCPSGGNGQLNETNKNPSVTQTFFVLRRSGPRTPHYNQWLYSSSHFGAVNNMKFKDFGCSSMNHLLLALCQGKCTTMNRGPASIDKRLLSQKLFILALPPKYKNDRASAFLTLQGCSLGVLCEHRLHVESQLNEVG